MAEFREFTQHTGYVTDAQRFGWSFVFQEHLPRHFQDQVAPQTPWWVRVPGAYFRRPDGRRGDAAHLDTPAVHVSWDDASAYCEWAGLRLPTEAEWEFAARGGLVQNAFPWGDTLNVDGKHLCNIWQGEFPDSDLAEDGFSRPAPVDSFPPNAFGLFNTVGNVWEWCWDYFSTESRAHETLFNPAGPPLGSTRVMKGGSYLCHASYCFRYRVSARSSNLPGSTTGNLGFRCVRDA